jgi:hypothetical protein
MSWNKHREYSHPIFAGSHLQISVFWGEDWANTIKNLQITAKSFRRPATRLKIFVFRYSFFRTTDSLDQAR